MRKLNSCDCAVLRLTLKRKWYNLIASGKKCEEYRDAKPYWTKRIMKWKSNQTSNWNDIATNKWLVVAFARGYRKPAMFFLITWCYIHEFADHPDWGEPSTPHWVIGLGERVTLVSPRATPRETSHCITRP